MGVGRIFAHSGWICWKDLLEFSRSKIRLVMLVVMPLFMMVMVGFIFPSEDSLQDTPIALANQDLGGDKGSLGNAFVTQLETVNEQTGMFELHPASGFDDIKDMIQKGDISGGLIVPANFTKDIQSGRQGVVVIVTDQSNPQISSMIQQVLSRTVESMGTRAAAMNVNMTMGLPANESLASVMPYTVEVRGTVPGDPNYFQFVAPGIMTMVVMMSLMTGLPHAISYEKDIGTLDGMLIAPINRMSIILGKVMAQTVRGMVQGFLIFLLAVLIFGVVVQGSILMVILLVLLTVYSFVGLGILITSFSDREETASMVMMTLMFPMMFLSGVFFPIQQMPGFMQYISSVLPLTYAAQAMRKVVVLGAGPQAILTEVTILAVFGTVMLVVAVPMFKRAMGR